MPLVLVHENLKIKGDSWYAHIVAIMDHPFNTSSYDTHDDSDERGYKLRFDTGWFYHHSLPPCIQFFSLE